MGGGYRDSLNRHVTIPLASLQDRHLKLCVENKNKSNLTCHAYLNTTSQLNGLVHLTCRLAQGGRHLGNRCLSCYLAFDGAD